MMGFAGSQRVCLANESPPLESARLRLSIPIAANIRHPVEGF